VKSTVAGAEHSRLVVHQVDGPLMAEIRDEACGGCCERRTLGTGERGSRDQVGEGWPAEGRPLGDAPIPSLRFVVDSREAEVKFGLLLNGD
jgi:hypothetical protein